MSSWQHNILSILDESGNSIFDLLLYILRARHPSLLHHRDGLQRHTHDALDLWSEQFPEEVQIWAVKAATETYRAELLQLIHPHAGFHFHGTRACLGQLESFSMVEMGKKVKGFAPYLWALLGVLLDADPARRRTAPKAGPSAVDEDAEMDLGEIGGEDRPATDNEEDWAQLEGSNTESESSDDDEPHQPAGPWDDTEQSSDDNFHADSEDDTPQTKKATKQRRCRKQNPAKQNAALLAIVSQNLGHQT
jgi:hypothetical protein